MMSASAKKEKLLHVFKMIYIIGLCAYPIAVIGVGVIDQLYSTWQLDWWFTVLLMLLVTCHIFVAWLVTFPSIGYLSRRKKSTAAPKCEAALAVLCTAMPIMSSVMLVAWFFSMLGIAVEMLLGAISDMALIFLFWGLPVICVLCGIAALILRMIVKKKELVAFYENNQ